MVNLVDVNPNHIAEAINDAMSLLDYAARHGIEVDPETLKNIDKLEGKSTETLADEDRLLFWDAFTTLADKLKPVTPASIKYTKGTGVKGISRRRVQVPLYVVVSSLALVVLVSVQVFWVGGTSLVADVKASLDIVQTIESTLIEKESELSAAEPAPLTTPEIDKHYVELRSAFARLTSDLESLHSWNLLWSNLPFMHPPFKSSMYPQYDMPTRANVDVASARLLLHAIYGYALPLLYGLLGACFFVLRTLSREIKTWTFTQQSSIAYLLRVTLGPLAGLAVGLLLLGGADPTVDATGSGTFQTTQTINEVASTIDLRALGPLTLAFVAGYGVELVFALLDRIVDAFTRTGT